MRVGKMIEHGIQGSLDFHAARSRNFPDQPRQGWSQAQIVEHGGPQQHGNVANHTKSLLDDAHCMRNPRRKLIPGIAARSRHARQFHAQASEHLTDLIVQFTRQVFSLLLLGCAHLRGQAPQFRFGRLGMAFEGKHTRQCHASNPNSKQQSQAGGPGQRGAKVLVGFGYPFSLPGEVFGHHLLNLAGEGYDLLAAAQPFLQKFRAAGVLLR